MEVSTMVLKESRPHLKKLAELAPRLNEATDRYMDELKTIESELARLNIGIAVQGRTISETADREGENGTRYAFASCIEYDRLDSGKWGFVIRRYQVMDQNEYGNWETWIELETTPIFQASRDMRLAAAEHIPALLETLIEVTEQKIDAVDKVSSH
jgi:hypothetical protein